MRHRAHVDHAGPSAEQAARDGEHRAQTDEATVREAESQAAWSNATEGATDEVADRTPRDLPATLAEALALIERLREELAAKDAALAENLDQTLRDRAELENFKRRTQRERSEALRFANEPLLRELLLVIDNLQRAVKAAQEAQRATRPPTTEGPLGALLSGVDMVLRQFAEVLGRFGVARVPAAAQPFDPAHHEAIAQIETEHHPSGTVIDEYTPGYRLHDRLLRAAQVTVAKAPEGSRGGSS